MQTPRPDLEGVLSSLTARERQIVDYVAAGRPNKVIAIDLGISLRTVEAHRARILSKLNSRNAMQLACHLCAHGRSGESPILSAAQGGACRLSMAKSGAGSYALHESRPDYVLPQAAPEAPDLDAQREAASK